jgi:energy-converting hydrogenase Eha subunit A
VLTDSPFTVFARSTLGGAVLLASAVVTSAAMLAWVSRTHKKDRRQAATAAVSFPTSIILLNVVLGR